MKSDVAGSGGHSNCVILGKQTHLRMPKQRILSFSFGFRTR